MGRGRAVRWSAAQSVAGCRAADGGAVGESRVVVQPWVTAAGRPRQQRWDGRRRRAAVSAMARTHSLHLLAYRVPVCARVCGSCGCRSEGRRRRGLAWPLRLSAPPAARDQGPPSRTIAHAHVPISITLLPCHPRTHCIHLKPHIGQSSHSRTARSYRGSDTASEEKVLPSAVEILYIRWNPPLRAASGSRRASRSGAETPAWQSRRRAAGPPGRMPLMPR